MGGLGKNIVRAARGAAGLCIMLLAWHVVAAEDDEVLREAARADPLELMHAAMLQFNRGKKDEAVFWFYAGQLRARYASGARVEYAQVLTVYMNIAEPLNIYAMRDVAGTTAAMRRVLAWDEQTLSDWAWAHSIDLRDAELVMRRTRAREGLVRFAELLTSKREEFEKQARALPMEERIAVADLPPRKPAVPAATASEPAAPFYVRGAGSSASLRLGTVEVVSRAALIEGKEPRYWVLRYYEWLDKNKKKLQYQSVKMQTDPTGSLCDSLQNGPVWFLTNFQWGKVTRTCQIPANVHVLIPVLEALLAPAPGMTATCQDLTSAARKLASEGAQVYLAVDGKELAEVRDYEGATGCVERDDPNYRDKKQTVAMHGFWVFLKPLPPGTHRIQFKGEPPKRYYDSQMELVHDVSYDITIKP